MSALAVGVPLTVITVLGLLLNSYILIVVLLTKQGQSANNLLLLHLGIVDILLCTVFLVFSSPSILRGGWVGGSPLCSFQGFLFTLLHPVALWTVCGLNCDRYYAISAPLHYANLVSTRKVALFLGGSWMISFILCIPPLFVAAPYRYSPDLGGCAPDFTLSDGAIWYAAVLTLATLVIPAVLVFGCNLRILMIARYHRHRIASAIYEVTLSAQVTITHQRNPFYLTKFRGRNAVVTVLQLLGSFTVLYVPYYCMILWQASVGNQVHPLFCTLATSFLTCSPPINGFIYGVKSKVLRKTFQNYWRKKMTKSEVNQEIQARTPSTCGSRRPSLTPLGLLGRPALNLHRRLSEVLLEQNRSPRPKIQRIASEMSWRPSGLTSSDLLPKRSRSVRERTKHASFNTLQVPSFNASDDDLFRSPQSVSVSVDDFNSPMAGTPTPLLLRRSDEEKRTLGHSLSSANLFFQRFMRREEASTPPKRTPQRSPRILITRAYSEEDQSPKFGSPTPDSQNKRRHLQRQATILGPDSFDQGSDNSSTSGSCEEIRRCFSLEDISETSTANLFADNPKSIPETEQNGGLWIKALGDDVRRKQGIKPYLLSWPTRRKNLSIKTQTKTKSVVDVAGSGHEFVL